MRWLKKLVSSLITKEEFWGIIGRSNQGRNLADELSKLAEDELFGYHYWWNYFHRQAYKQDLWAVAYVVMGGCSDDGFIDFCNWLISRGKSVYMNACENADSLCGEFEKLTDDDHDYPSQEELAYVPMEVFKEKFDKDFYDAEFKAQEHIEFEETPFPSITFEWEEDDEESIRKVCPHTFDKWLENDRF